MAHQITSTDKVVLAKTGAWHNLGKVFADLLNEEQVQANAFPWEPICRKAYYRTDSADSPLVECPDRKIVLRSDNHAYLGTVGIGFGIVGNGDLLKMVGTAFPGIRYETAGTLFGGRRVWVLANLGAFEVTKGDENRQYLMVANGHDGSFRLFFGETNVRVVCNNTLTSAIFGGEGETNDGITAYRHTKKVRSRAFDAVKGIAKAREKAQEFQQIAKRLAEVRINGKQAKDYLEKVFPAPTAKAKKGEGNILDAILENDAEDSRLMSDLLAGDKKAQERAEVRHAKLLDGILTIYGSEQNAGGFGENLWTAFNAVTDWVDHDRITRGTDDSDRADNRFASTVWGSGNQVKQQALAAAVKMAN